MEKEPLKMQNPNKYPGDSQLLTDLQEDFLPHTCLSRMHVLILAHVEYI
jgi:hypothetical protein